MGVYRLGLVGESHYQEPIARLREGERVVLEHERDNPHDPDAVCAWTAAGEKIGYVARGGWAQRAVATDGQALSARVLEITGGGRGRPSRGVVLEVRTGEHAEAVAAPRTAEEKLRGCGQSMQQVGCAIMSLVVLGVLVLVLLA